MWKEDLQNIQVMIKRSKMFTGESPFNAGYEKEDWKQEYGVKD